ncbi:MAG: protein kinase [Kofleriaceae bacterium]
MFVCTECGASQPMPTACSSCGGQVAQQDEDPLLGAVVGPYRIARLLGVGGMGRVYKGVQPQIGSRVAVKVLSRECTDRKDLVERFFSEARAVNLIRHESIVNVLDLAMLPDGRPYIVMEYLDGAPLSDLVAQRGAMPLGGVARLAVEVLEALGAAHAKGIVHRDLKPDNVFITPAGRAKVLDFGIAKLLPELGGSFTQTGSLLGTPHYMSPEQASGKNIDFRTDLYAMGVILFECMTGQKPFLGDSMFDLLRKHVDLPPPPPRSLRPDLPPALEQVILVALNKDPQHRFPSAAAMSAALQQATSGMAPEQWAIISGSPSGVAPSPSGAGWGTPASWGGAARPAGGSAPAPLPQPPGHAPGYAGPGPQGYPGTPYPGPEARNPSTATAGQVVGGRSGGKTVALIGGFALLVGGAVFAAVVMSGGSSKPAAEVVAEQADAGADVRDGAGGAEVAAAGSAAPAADVPSDDGSADDQDDADADVAAALASAQAVGAELERSSEDSGELSTPELREFEKLLKGMPAAQRAVLRKQLRITEQQIKKLPAAQRAMMLRNLRDAVKLAQSQAKLATTLSGQAEAPPPLAEAEDPDDDGRDDDDDAPATDPVAPPLPPRWGSKRFDVTAYLPTATAAARRVAADAKLFRIDAEAVLPDGLVDLTQGHVRYGFISKARAQRPSHIPLGGKWNPNCQINVWVESSGISVREFVGCKETPVPAPRCSLKQRWQLAIAAGAPSSNAIAELGYRASVIDGKPVWFFDIGDAFDDGPSKDVCP